MTGAPIEQRRADGNAVRRPSALLTCVGLAALVAGTFLPWLTSGSARRNSYAADGSLRRLLDGGRAIGLALAAWPFVSLACAIATGLLIVGLARAGAALALVTGLAAGTIAVAALRAGSSVAVSPAVPGPALTGAGAAATVLFALSVLVHRRIR